MNAEYVKTTIRLENGSLTLVVGCQVKLIDELIYNLPKAVGTTASVHIESAELYFDDKLVNADAELTAEQEALVYAEVRDLLDKGFFY